jgi:hypothetical protein
VKQMSDEDNYTEKDFMHLMEQFSIINHIKMMKLNELKALRKRIDEEIAKRSEEE